MLNWTEDNVFLLDDTEFRVGYTSDAKPRGTEFLLFKPKWMVDLYVQMIADLRPQNIVELGIYRGGSVGFLSLLAKPRKHVAIELRQPSPSDRLDAWIDDHGLRDIVRPHYGIDQADNDRLEKLIADEFGDSSLDLVIDDASHLFEPTVASFNVLFPLLRPGGVYVIEDWASDLELESRIAQDAAVAEAVRREVEQRRQSGVVTTPLTRLVFEIILAAAYTELIEDIYLRRHWLVVKRGPGDIEGDPFDITACSLDRGRRLLSAQ